MANAPMKRISGKPAAATGRKRKSGSTEGEAAAPAKKQPKIVRLTATDLAEKQREISVSEFFTKNRHLLGFDSPAKALLTTVKEAVDNALDACEEAGILPDLLLEIQEISETRYRIAVQDNGPSPAEQVMDPPVPGPAGEYQRPDAAAQGGQQPDPVEEVHMVTDEEGPAVHRIASWPSMSFACSSRSLRAWSGFPRRS